VILVAGGTGRLGALVVAELAARGERVRVLTRDDTRATPVLGPLVEVAIGDVRDLASLRAAATGVSTVISAVHGFVGPGKVTPESVDRDGNANLVSAAGDAGADLVLVSVVGASKQHPMELFRMKAAAEGNLRRSGVPWTIVRASAFLELYLDLMRRTAGKSGRPLVFGRGRNPINFVPVTDVAAAVVRATLERSERGRIVTVAGPRNLTLNEVAAMAQLELGVAGRTARHVPRAALRVLAATRVVADSAISRQAKAALIMDTTDMTVEDAKSVS
jgi:NADH dehydrogenase